VSHRAAAIALGTLLALLVTCAWPPVRVWWFPAPISGEPPTPRGDVRWRPLWARGEVGGDLSDGVLEYGFSGPSNSAPIGWRNRVAWEVLAAAHIAVLLLGGGWLAWTLRRSARAGRPAGPAVRLVAATLAGLCVALVVACASVPVERPPLLYHNGSGVPEARDLGRLWAWELMRGDGLPDERGWFHVWRVRRTAYAPQAALAVLVGGFLALALAFRVPARPRAAPA